MFFSSFDGNRWSQELPGVGGGTSEGPSLAVFNGRLFAAWKGVEGDQRMFFSSFDGNAWSGQLPGVGGGTSDGPSLAVFNDRLFAAWKGVEGDTRMFSSHFDGSTWSPEHSGVGRGTSHGPSLAPFNGTLVAGWKGMPNDSRMFFSSFPGSPSVLANVVQDSGLFLNISGQGYTHDGTVTITYGVTVDSTFTQGTDSAKTDSDGGFDHRVPLHGLPHSGSVQATDDDSLESATHGIG
jgi:hypothetical protein